MYAESSYFYVIFEVVLKMVECFLTGLIHYVCGYTALGIVPPAHKIISTWTTLFCFYFHAGFSVNVSVDCRILLKVKLFCFVTIYPEAAKIKSKYNDIEWLSEKVLNVAPISCSQNANSTMSCYKDLFNF